MKKLLNGFVVFLIAFLAIQSTNVLALTTGTSYSLNSLSDRRDYFANCPKCASNGSDVAYINQYVLAGEYAAYCMDASLNNSTTVKVVDSIELGDDDFTAYHAGLAAIGTLGYNNKKTEGYGLKDLDFYAATNIAIRLYAIAMKNGATNTAGHVYQHYYQYALSNTAALWMYENKDLVNKVRGLTCDGAKCFWNSLGLSNIAALAGANGYGENSILTPRAGKEGVLTAAKKMFVAGFKAADNFNTNGTVGVATVSLSENKTLSTQTPNTATQFVRKDYYTLSLKEFGDNDKITNLSISCTNCSEVNGNPTIAITGYSTDGGVTFTSGKPTDADLVTTGSKDIILEITGKINRNSDYDCTPLSYKITYKFESDVVNYEIYILKNTSSTNSQRFYAIVTDSSTENTGDTKENVRKMDFCDNNYCEYYDPEDFEEMTDEEFEDYTDRCCTDLDTYCNDSTNPAQQDYCEIYEEYCGACDTEIVVPSVCTYIDGEDGEAVAEDMTGYIKSAIDDDGHENIKACLLRRKKDEAGHSYKAIDNSYCQVYCKEDYAFDLPTAVSVNSGTYFQLDATISGTKTCYTSEIDVEKFKNDISNLDVNSDAYNEKVSEYNACVNMTVDYECFEPIIEYEYEEVYNDQLGENNKFVQSGDFVETNKKTTYCNGDINDDYSCQSATTSTPSTFTVNGKTFNYAKYIKSTITKTGKYITPSVFYNVRPTGSITTDGTVENSVLINGLPVSIKTEKGRHKFTLSLQNIGEYYDRSTCEAGRLIGDENSVYNKQNADKGITGKYVAEYQCYYDVNCPECESSCEGPLCDIEICEGPECKPTCLGFGCAYDNGLSYAYRTVSLNNLNTSNRKLGYNWDATNSVKARETIEKIESTGEAAYENPEYSITLTPALITAIKEYNKSQLDNGGYANNTLTCSDDKYGNEKVNCESNFLAQLVSGEIGSSNNKITVPDSEDKFTSWQDSDYCNGTCTITKGSGIGPSWK